MFFLIVLCFSVFSSARGIVYDSFTGTPVSQDVVIRHIKDNTTFSEIEENYEDSRSPADFKIWLINSVLRRFWRKYNWCINDIQPCDAEEWRRLDGSCNNLKHPARGTTHTPFYRMLPAVSDKDCGPKNAKSDLPLVRRVRTNFLSEAQVPDQTFTVLASYFLVFISTDVSNLHDTINYILWTPYCCLPKGKEDDMCAPITVPADDPVHRFSGIRCFNLTRPMTFQSQGCRKKDTFPERIMSATPLFDLSSVYGNSLDKALEGRLFKGGLLKYEVEQGRIWPPQDVNHTSCLRNQKPYETRCHKTPSDEINSLMPINIVTIWFWRLHNHVANRLAKMNPCWDDERLFYTARDINIAIQAQILLYELLPMMMGYNNLINDGVLFPHGFRDIYKEQLTPQLSMEFPLTLRWLHKMQEGTIKMYDANGTYIKKEAIVDLSIRTGYLALDNNIDYLTQGSFRQPSAKMDDHVVDPDMAERMAGIFQISQDTFSSDLAKNRLMYIQPYVKYLEHFSGRTISSFEDLAEYFEPEVLEKLTELYNSVEDIDLLAAMWVEKPLDGGRVPHMFYCIVVEQLLRTMMSDRHWYERPNRPHAFTIEQLQEIRKVSIARVLCDVGDTVSHIQARAFQRIGPENPMQSCEEIPDINIKAWKDYTCSKKIKSPCD